MTKQLSPQHAEEFETLLNFLAYFDKTGWISTRSNTSDIRAETAAIVAQYGNSKALTGLRMALSDTLQMTSTRTAKWVCEFDERCRTAGIKSLSEFRVAYWSKYKRVLVRGKINNHEQFDMVSAVVSDMAIPIPASDRDKLSEMLQSYEQKIA